MGASVAIAAVGLGLSAAGMYQSYEASQAQSDYYSGLQNYYSQMAADYKSGMDYWNRRRRDSEFAAAMDQAEAARLNAEAMLREANLAEFTGQVNLQAARMDAREIEERAKQAAHMVRMEADRLAGTQVATYHASGVAMSGTPALVMMEDMDKAEQDIADILAAGEYDATMALAGGLMDAATAESAVDRALTGAINSFAQARGALKGAGWIDTLRSLDAWQTNMKTWEMRTTARMAGMQSDLAEYSGRAGLAMGLGSTFLQLGMMNWGHTVPRRYGWGYSGLRGLGRV